MNRILVLFFLILGIMFFYTNVLAATTVPSGNISGTWKLADSPYYLMGDCTVQEGDTLTIEPGVQVKLPENASINVYGQIIAVGKSSLYISFNVLNESIYWNKIFIDYGDKDSEFKYCSFNNAKTAIYLNINASTDNSMRTNISNCIFTNCVNEAIYGYSFGYTKCLSYGCYSMYPKLSPNISSCVFDSTNCGIIFHILGDCRYFPMVGCVGSYGAANPLITNNIFKNLSVALKMTISDYHTDSFPVITNNNFLFCDTGIDILNPYDAKIRNNIFFKNSTAIKRSGDLSGLVEYNNFFDNESDFVGYPSTYGSILIKNNNGTDCDIAFNIFSDPMLASDEYHLTQDSPCIEAATSTDAPYSDIDGESRPQGNEYDIGVDEFEFTNLIAYNQTVTTYEGTPISITLNGFDPTGNNNLIYSIEKHPTHGILTGIPPIVIYTPNKNFYDIDNFTFKVNNDVGGSSLANVAITVKQKFIETDIYEPDNTFETASIIHLYDNIQQSEDIPGYDWNQEHLFETEGDQDWVKLYGVKNKEYTISVKNPEPECDAVIEIYYPDGQTLLKTVNDHQVGQPEIIKFTATSNDIFYIKIRQFDHNKFGPKSGYRLTAMQNSLKLGVILKGHVYDQRNNQPPNVETRIKSSHQTGACVVLNDGSFLMPHPPGTYIFIIEAKGFISVKQQLTIPEELLYNQDFYIVENKNKQPIANIFAQPTSGQAALEVEFESISSGDPFDLLVWDFGDGYTSTEEATTHTYKTEGNYLATLTVGKGDSESFTEVNINVSSGNGGGGSDGGGGGGCFLSTLR